MKEKYLSFSAVLKKLRNNELSRVDLKNQRLETSDARKLAEALPLCTNLLVLDLESTYLGTEGIQILTEVFSECWSLLEVKLGHNKLGPDGARAFAAVLSDCWTLTTLDVQGNNIGTEAAQAFVKALPLRPTLVSLDLSINQMGDGGAQALAEVLPRCQALTTLDVSINRIYQKGIAALVAALAQCPAITKLRYEGNHGTDEQAKQIEEIIKRNKSRRDNLFKAVAAGGLKEVQACIAQSASVWSRDEENGNTSLHVAAEMGNLPLVKYLVSQGAPINAVNENHKTPEDVALEGNKKNVVKFFELFDSRYRFRKNNIGQASTPFLLASHRPKEKIGPAKIPQEQLVFQEEIGKGSYSRVFRGILSSPGAPKQQVAIKQLNDTDNFADVVKNFKREVAIQAQLESPGVVKLLGVTQTVQFYCLVMEHMQWGTLNVFLSQQNPEKFSWVIRLFIALNIARGLACLHMQEPPITHSDIKSLNILINDKHEAKLADFGSAVRKGENRENAGNGARKGTLLWTAPEVFENEERTPASDVYSFGIVGWEIASLKFPYRNIDAQYIPGKVANNIREEFDEEWNTPKRYVELMQQCWDGEPQKRPDAAAVEGELERIYTQNLMSPTLFASSDGTSRASKRLSDRYLKTAGVDTSVRANTVNDGETREMCVNSMFTTHAPLGARAINKSAIRSSQRPALSRISKGEQWEEGKESEQTSTSDSVVSKSPIGKRG